MNSLDSLDPNLLLGLALVPADLILLVMFFVVRGTKRRAADAAEQAALDAEGHRAELEQLEAQQREAKARVQAAEQRAVVAESRVTNTAQLEAQHRDVKARAQAAEQRVLVAESRLTEMERVALFGQALARAIDLDAIRDVVVRHFPQLLGTEDVWVMTRIGGEWRVLFNAARRRGDADGAQKRIADAALESRADPWKVDPFHAGGHLCLPMTAGGDPVGVIGVPESVGPFTDSRQRALAAAATLLGLAIKNAELFGDVQAHSVRDVLTGCFNRTFSLDALGSELRRARRSQSQTSLIIFDLDHFKQLNDQHGQLCGDAVLAAVGARIHQVLRASDLACRYGGEEFLVLLPDTASEGAKRVAHTLRRELADMTLQWKDEPLTVTASFGVATARPSEVDGHALIARANEALYRAKDQGRNCVRLSIETAVA